MPLCSRSLFEFQASKNEVVGLFSAKKIGSEPKPRCRYNSYKLLKLSISFQCGILVSFFYKLVFKVKLLMSFQCGILVPHLFLITPLTHNSYSFHSPIFQHLLHEFNGRNVLDFRKILSFFSESVD